MLLWTAGWYERGLAGKKTTQANQLSSQHFMTGKDVQTISSTLHPGTFYELQQKTRHLAVLAFFIFFSVISSKTSLYT